MGLAQLENKRKVQKPLAHTRSESNKRRPCSNTLTPLPLIPLHLGLSLSVILIPLPFKKTKKNLQRQSSHSQPLRDTQRKRERDGEDNTYGGVFHQTVALYFEVRRSFSPGPFPRFLRSSEEARLLTSRWW